VFGRILRLDVFLLKMVFLLVLAVRRMAGAPMLRLKLLKPLVIEQKDRRLMLPWSRAIMMVRHRHVLRRLLMRA
jgi:hypothetical protein